MHKTFLLMTVLALGLAAPAYAEVLVIPDDGAPAPIATPDRGSSQAAVLASYGEPLQRHAPAGGGSAQQPPITRWDYDGYSVFFENSTVIDVVIKDQPKPIRNKEQLQ
jgi:hypothetical protein